MSNATKHFNFPMEPGKELFKKERSNEAKQVLKTIANGQTVPDIVFTYTQVG